MNADGYYLDSTFIEVLEKYFGKKYGVELVIRIENDWYRCLKYIDCLYKRGAIPVLRRIKIELPFREDDCRVAQYVADKLEDYLEELDKISFAFSENIEDGKEREKMTSLT